MKSKNIGQLTREKLLENSGYEGMTWGNGVVWRFCNAVEAGNIPDSEDLKIVAHALSVLKDGNAGTAKLSEVAKRLGVSKKRGQEASEKMKWWATTGPVLDYLLLVDKAVSDGVVQRKAEIHSRRFIADRIGIRDRAMRDKISKYITSATLMMDLINPEERDVLARRILEAKN